MFQKLMILLGSLLFATYASAATIVVPTGKDAVVNGHNFQAAIDAAALGDTLVLNAKSTFLTAGGFVFGYKPGGTGTDADYITVQSSSTHCPKNGERVNPPRHAKYMPKLIGSGYPVIAVNVRAHHWRFVCLDVSNDRKNYSSALILTATNGSASGGYATWQELYATHDIVFDRLFVHNPEVTAGHLHPKALEIYAGRGIGIGGVNISVLNSWIGSFAGYFPGTTVMTDSYGIFGGTGESVLIQNNRIEAFFNNIFWAGAAVNPDHTSTVMSPTMTSATLTNTTGLNVADFIALEVPLGTNGCQTDSNRPRCWQTAVIDAINGNDIVYRGIGAGKLTAIPIDGGKAQWNGGQPTNMMVHRNYLWKNPWWQVRWPGYAKDYIEVKTCVNCTYTANTFEGACSAALAFEVAQAGNNGEAPWNTISNNVFANNLLLGDVSGIFNALNGAQASGQFTVTSTPGKDILITNNFWERVLGSCGNNPWVGGFLMTAGGSDVTFTHNTIRNSNAVNPVMNLGSGTIVDGLHGGQENLMVRDNIFNYGPSGFAYNSPYGYQGAWPPNGIEESHNIVVITGPTTNNPSEPGEVPDSYHVSNDKAVGFTKIGSNYRGFKLSNKSLFKGGASDGTDPGVDFAILDAALNGN